MTSAQVRFAELWEAYAHRVLAYASRHVDATSAQDVMSETFLVAWRRLQDIPGDPLPWLLVVARNTISNRRRSVNRARVVELELTRLARVARPVAGAEGTAVARDTMLRTLASLSSAEREAVLLTAWDGLDATAAAQVAGCSPSTFSKRLSRARARLESAHDGDDESDTAGSSSRSAR